MKESQRLLNLILEGHIEEVLNESTMPKLNSIITLNTKLNKYNYGFLYKGKLVDDFNEFGKYYRTISPANFEKYKDGVCWDYAEFQNTKLSEIGIGYSTFYIELINKMSSTHTFTVIPADKIIYIESSYQKIQGVWESNSLSDIFNFILTNMFEDEGKKSPF